MIGQTIQASSRFSWGAVVFLLLGAAATAVAVAQQNLHWALVSILPYLIGIGLWWVRPREFAAHFTEDTLEVMEPRLSIPYATLQGLRARGRPGEPTRKGPRAYPMQVFHEGGFIQIPGRLNVPSDDVYKFLLEQFPPAGSRNINPVLEKYLRQQEEMFGSDRVWSYRARRFLGKPLGSRRGQAVSLAIIAAGVLWLIAGAMLGKKYEAWLGAGFVAGLLGALFFFLFWLDSLQRGGQAKIKNWQQAGLIISPVGLALVQGATQGQMRWDELRDVSLRGKPKSFQLQRDDARTGILLKFEGATIVIADIYDRPLPIIHQRIVAYWRP